jgi:hypothetical protein
VYIEEGKLERAFDLVKRLHLEKSFDIVMSLADNHRNLVERIEAEKQNKFVPSYDGSSSEEDDTVTHKPRAYGGRHISPETTDKRCREGTAQGRSVRSRVNK